MTFDFKKEFFDTIATFVQTIAGWIIPATKNIAQISNGIPILSLPELYIG